MDAFWTAVSAVLLVAAGVVSIAFVVLGCMMDSAMKGGK